MANKNVAVLLSSYNGEKYISEQINSILNQENVTLDLYIRDDGSSDRTPDLLETYKESNIFIQKEKNIGVTNSFLYLLENVNEYDYYAFSDQDDVWDKDKLFVAINYLADSELKPALYFSTTRVVDQNLNVIEQSSSVIDDFAYDPIRAVLGNNCTGCTMVLNRQLRDRVVMYHPQDIIMHDHWIYALCIMLGGDVYYDKTPHISYRQHASNELGNKVSLKKRIINSSIKKGKCIRSNIACQMYKNYKDMLLEPQKSVLMQFAFYKDKEGSKIKLARIILKSNLQFARKLITLMEIIVGVL